MTKRGGAPQSGFKARDRHNPGETKDGRKKIAKISCPARGCLGRKVWVKGSLFRCTKCHRQFELGDRVTSGRFKSIQEARKWLKTLKKKEEKKDDIK